jgi:CheY-like chemotaxis protein
VTASGREIAETMQREIIDLVVLDLRMPGEDGMELAQGTSRSMRMIALNASISGPRPVGR